MQLRKHNKNHEHWRWVIEHQVKMHKKMKE